MRSTVTGGYLTPVCPRVRRRNFLPSKTNKSTQNVVEEEAEKDEGRNEAPSAEVREEEEDSVGRREKKREEWGGGERRRGKIRKIRRRRRRRRRERQGRRTFQAVGDVFLLLASRRVEIIAIHAQLILLPIGQRKPKSERRIHYIY